MRLKALALLVVLAAAGCSSDPVTGREKYLFYEDQRMGTENEHSPIRVSS
ncbi:MAG: hypothetical protein ABFR53_09340 [Actinomycetota bacterium]